MFLAPLLGKTTPQYKLHYFNLRARGEVIRWIFAYAGQEFEDHRVEMHEWSAAKEHAPFGTLPYMELDGKHMSSSVPVARFLARKFGLAGQNAFEEAQADAIVDYTGDASKDYGLWVSAVLQKQVAEAETIKEKYLGETVVPFLDGLEQQLRSNPKGTNHFVGDNVTWADLVVAHFLDSVIQMSPNILDKYHLLKSHNDHVHQLKGISEWVAKRPQNNPL